MSASMSDKASAEPDLTPILDLVFQLITFFMLVINFKAAALDLSLQLPVIGSARPVDTKGQVDLLILNIDMKGKLTMYGNPYEPGPYIAGEAQAARLKQRAEPGADLASTVVIRAHKDTSFDLLNHVIKVCQENGYRKFALKAMNKAEGT